MLAEARLALPMPPQPPWHLTGVLTMRSMTFLLLAETLNEMASVAPSEYEPT